MKPLAAVLLIAIGLVVGTLAIVSLMDPATPTNTGSWHLLIAFVMLVVGRLLWSKNEMSGSNETVLVPYRDNLRLQSGRKRYD